MNNPGDKDEHIENFKNMIFEQYDMDKTDRDNLVNSRQHHLDKIKLLDSSDEDGGEHGR